MIPAGLVEELELERHAVAELDARAARLWAAGGLPARAAALDDRAAAAEARAHVAALELELVNFLDESPERVRRNRRTSSTL